MKPSKASKQLAGNAQNMNISDMLEWIMVFYQVPIVHSIWTSVKELDGKGVNYREKADYIFAVVVKLDLQRENGSGRCCTICFKKSNDVVVAKWSPLSGPLTKKDFEIVKDFRGTWDQVFKKIVKLNNEMMKSIVPPLKIMVKN